MYPLIPFYCYISRMATPLQEKGLQDLHAPESNIGELITLLGDIIADEHQATSLVMRSLFHWYLLIFSCCHRFPSHIFDSLLRCGVIADLQYLNRLASTLDQNRERIREILHRDSLRLLAYVLLHSDNAIEQEKGLYLILVWSMIDHAVGEAWTDLSRMDLLKQTRFLYRSVTMCRQFYIASSWCYFVYFLTKHGPYSLEEW